MAEQAKIAQKPGFAQQIEPLFSDPRLSRRSLRSQPGPTPPQPDFTQDALALSEEPQPAETGKVLAFRRTSQL